MDASRIHFFSIKCLYSKCLNDVKMLTYAHFVITHKILSVAASLSPTIVHLVVI